MARPESGITREDVLELHLRLRGDVERDRAARAGRAGGNDLPPRLDARPGLQGDGLTGDALVVRAEHAGDRVDMVLAVGDHLVADRHPRRGQLWLPARRPP